MSMESGRFSLLPMTLIDLWKIREENGSFFAYLQNETDNYLLSYLAIPYFPDWNGMIVQCMGGLSMNGSSVCKDLPYVIAGKEEK